MNIFKLYYSTNLIISCQHFHYYLLFMVLQIMFIKMNTHMRLRYPINNSQFNSFPIKWKLSIACLMWLANIRNRIENQLWMNIINSFYIKYAYINNYKSDQNNIPPLFWKKKNWPIHLVDLLECCKIANFFHLTINE